MSRFADLGPAWIWYTQYVLRHGEEIADDQGAILEAPPVIIAVEDVSSDDPVVKRWGDTATIRLYSEKMFSRDLIPELQQSYGRRLFYNAGIDQIAWMCDRLRRKPYTKSATVGLLVPGDEGPRIPCMTSVNGRIRRGKFLIDAVFRSQNVMASYANFIGVSRLGDYVADLLDVEVGTVTFLVISPHLYLRDKQRAIEFVAREAS